MVWIISLRHVNSKLKPILCSRINAIREVAGRCPLAITEDLLQDLAQYKTHKDKSEGQPIFKVAVLNTQINVCSQHQAFCLHSSSDVMMSARGLIQLFRTLNPRMLHKKDRVRQVKPLWAVTQMSVHWTAELNFKNCCEDILKHNMIKNKKQHNTVNILIEMGCCSLARGDPQKHLQRPGSKITESSKLRIISPEQKSSRSKRKTKRKRMTKVSGCCIVESTGLELKGRPAFGLSWFKFLRSGVGSFS